VSEPEKIKIGAWTVSPALNLLECGTRSITVEPRAMDVLMALAERAGTVVSIDELMASVWKGVIVGEGSVYLAIRQLRQALDDSSEGASYIQTIPKRGYRLTVPVTPSEPVGSAPIASPPVSVRPSSHRMSGPFRWRFATYVAVAVVTFAVFALILRREPPAVPEHSVAVLPFDNLSTDAQQEYFADGITAELLSTLSRVRDLRVTGPISSFYFKDRNASVGAVGAALGVEHVLEGSVRKAGERVRVTVQLSKVRTGERLWSETYERRLDDIFVIQDEIARAVANALQIKLGVGDVGRVPGMTRSVAAYDEYLRGMALNLESRPESFALAIIHLQRAVALDPSFSVAWAGLHAVCANGAFISPDHAEEWRRKGTDALEHARALTPDAPHVLLETGIRAARSGRWLEANDLYEQLTASYARYGMANQAWGPRGVFLLSVGRVREAIDALERARAHEPMAPALAGFFSEAELAAGDLTAATAEIDRGLKLEGLDGWLVGMGVTVALTRGDRAEIEKRLASMVDGLPGVPLNRRVSQFLDAPAGVEAEIRKLASQATDSEKALLARWAAYYRKPELALELLTEAVPNLSLPSVLWQPLMSDVRRLPGFKDLVRRLGLVDYWRAHGWSDFCHPLDREDFACG
jgi:TolB-like protein/DNA-binding winged helix-turn-helix (wHTH) protein